MFLIFYKGAVREYLANANLPKLLRKSLKIVDQLLSPRLIPQMISRRVSWPADQKRLSKLLKREFVIGVPSRKGNFCTLRLARRRKRLAQGSKVPLGDVLVALPTVIAGEVDVIPAKRGHVRKQGIIDFSVLT